MKILINGYTVTEQFKIKLNKNQNDLTLAERVLTHIKKNKNMYARLVVITALLLHYNINFVFAESVEASLDATFSQLVKLLLECAKWGCLAMGLKKTVEEMLSGANFKQASIGGIQYWLCYIFIQFYPKLFDMINF